MSEPMPVEVIVEQLRLAFAEGQRATGEQLFMAALDAGLAWDLATRAVAEGEASHRRSIRGVRRPSGGSLLLV